MENVTETELKTIEIVLKKTELEIETELLKFGKLVRKANFNDKYSIDRWYNSIVWIIKLKLKTNKTIYCILALSSTKNNTSLFELKFTNELKYTNTEYNQTTKKSIRHKDKTKNDIMYHVSEYLTMIEFNNWCNQSEIFKKIENMVNLF